MGMNYHKMVLLLRLMATSDQEELLDQIARHINKEKLSFDDFMALLQDEKKDEHVLVESINRLCLQIEKLTDTIKNNKHENR